YFSSQSNTAMKVFTARQIKEADSFTIYQEGIKSVDLMERAAKACYRWISQNFNPNTSFLLICGMGNNGGDGLALTRILLQEGFSAKAIVLQHREDFSSDAAHQLKLLQHLDPELVQLLPSRNFIAELPVNVVLIDALLGSGLSRDTEGWLATFIERCNELPNTKIAIDLPSGLPADNLPKPGATVFKADYTLSFELYKRSFFHQEAALFCGTIRILSIGLSTTYLQDTHSNIYVLDEAKALSIYKPRKAFSHKGTYGKAVLMGGSYGQVGDMLLSTQAALRSGAGLVVAIAPECAYSILQGQCPEAMVHIGGDKVLSSWSIPNKSTAIGIGPGLGKDPQTAIAFAQFLAENKLPLIIDADALNLIAENKSLWHFIPPGSILCPHPKEFERLFGSSQNSLLQTELARGKAMKHNVYIILKGHHSAIATPSGNCWYNNN